MDAEFSDLFLQDCPTALGFDSASDAGYYSACDGLSPASSSAAESSSCLSPTWFPSSGACGWASPLSPPWSSSPGQEEPDSETDLQSNSVQLQAPALPQNQEQTGGFQEPPAQTCFTIQPIQLRVPALPSLHQQRAAFPLQEQTQTQAPQWQQDGKRSRGRTRQPGKKRHNASEREKLRMRDLTKALHHLRSYLPASVAPAGQTLTKIQTLRYTIRYIAHLSAQVEASHGDTGVRMEQYHSQAQTPSQVQGFLQGLSPVQHLHCPQQQTLDPWSQHRLQYGIHSEPNAPCQQNQTLIANCLTSAGEPHMTLYQQQNLVPVSHGFCYSPNQL